MPPHAQPAGARTHDDPIYFVNVPIYLYTDIANHLSDARVNIYICIFPLSNPQYIIYRFTTLMDFFFFFFFSLYFDIQYNIFIYIYR